MNEKKLLSSSDAAKKLGFTPDYIRRLCLKGIIKARRLAGNWIMTEKAIEGIRRQRKPKSSKEQ